MQMAGMGNEVGAIAGDVAGVIESLPPAILDKVAAEFKRGWHLQEMLAKSASHLIAKANQQQHRAVDGIGEVILRVPSHLYHEVVQVYGREAWADKGFCRDVAKRFPEFRVKSKGTKLMVAR